MMLLMMLIALPFMAQGLPGCSDLPSQQVLASALAESVKPTGGSSNGGLDNNMWAVIVDRSGVVCAVARTGEPGDQWPASRIIAAQKAFTANSLSLPKFAMSTANLFAATQPGGFMFGLQHSHPINVAVAYNNSVSPE